MVDLCNYITEGRYNSGLMRLDTMIDVLCDLGVSRISSDKYPIIKDYIKLCDIPNIDINKEMFISVSNEGVSSHKYNISLIYWPIKSKSSEVMNLLTLKDDDLKNVVKCIRILVSQIDNEYDAYRTTLSMDDVKDYIEDEILSNIDKKYTLKITERKPEKDEERKGINDVYEFSVLKGDKIIKSLMVSKDNDECLRYNDSQMGGFKYITYLYLNWKNINNVIKEFLTGLR